MLRSFSSDFSTQSADAAQKVAADPPRLARGFWRKIARVGAALPFSRDLLAIYYCARDHKTPLEVRAAVLAALAYFVLPLDAIPDFLVGIGFADDAAVLFGTLKLVGSHVTDAHRAAAEAALDRIVQGEAVGDAG